eukprot:6546236-Alexandrium_andersonii.AAC.1
MFSGKPNNVRLPFWGEHLDWAPVFALQTLVGPILFVLFSGLLDFFFVLSLSKLKFPGLGQSVPLVQEGEGAVREPRPSGLRLSFGDGLLRCLCGRSGNPIPFHMGGRTARCSDRCKENLASNNDWIVVGVEASARVAVVQLR